MALLRAKTLAECALQPQINDSLHSTFLIWISLRFHPRNIGYTKIMKTKFTLNHPLMQSLVRKSKVIVLTLCGVFGVVALFSVLANVHGGAPYAQQIHLRMLGIAEPAKRADPALDLYHAGYVALDERDPLWHVLYAQSGLGVDQSNESNAIRAALDFKGGLQKRDVIAMGKRSVTQTPPEQLSNPNSPSWNEITQWCISITSAKGSEQYFGNMLWELSRVQGANVIGLPQRDGGASQRSGVLKELTPALAERMAAQYAEGIVLPVTSVRVGRTQDTLGGTVWSFAFDSKICPKTNKPRSDPGLALIIAEHEAAFVRKTLPP
jgi:hypothetical protein